MILEYYQIRGVPPTRANQSDAGMDINYNPDIEKEGIRHRSCYRGQEPDYWTFIRPGESAILPTGLKFGVPHGYMLEVKNRSGVAAKRKLIVGACVVDAGYDGEVFVNLHNVGKEVQF